MSVYLLHYTAVNIDTLADENCQDGAISEEQIDGRINLQECVLLPEKETEGDKKMDKLHCQNGQRNEKNIFMLLPSAVRLMGYLNKFWHLISCF